MAQEIRFASADGTALFARRWPAADARGRALVIHGYAEHSGRYEHVAAALNSIGLDVWALDLRGHGFSAGARGHAARFSDYHDDAEALRLRAEAEGPAKKTFLLGHSMGGLVSLGWVLARRPPVAGMIITSPFLGVAVPPPAWKASLGRLLSTLWPACALPSGLDPAGLSRDAEVGRKYAADPLVFKTVTARWFTEAMASIAEVRRRAAEIRIPSLILQAGADRIADPRRARPLFEALGAADKTFIEYPGFYHEIMNETEKERVLGEIQAWISARLE